MDRAAPTSVLGIARDTLLPSFKLQSSLSLVAYTAARLNDRVELKDWLWPSGMVINAWATAMESQPNLSMVDTIRRLPWSEKTLLTGVTLWGVRLFFHVASRSLDRGKDDPRYEEVKKEPGFWNKALYRVFLPEAIFQSIISLPFTAPFRMGVIHSTPPNLADVTHGLAVAIFSAGFALEVLADWQKSLYKKEGGIGLNKEGVWSIVRHPNYLGDALIHFSFPLLLYSSGRVHPLLLLGPIANYFFLRYIGGDKENEKNQEERYQAESPLKNAELQSWREEENSFWPGFKQLTNRWTWGIVGVGIAGAVLEKTLRDFFTSS